MSSETTKQPEEKPKSRTVCVEDPALTMVEPDTMTPHQYFERLFTESTLVPEKRLMLAVLEDAIASFQRNFINGRNNHGQLEDCEVEAWLESDDMSWPFSFHLRAYPTMNGSTLRICPFSLYLQYSLSGSPCLGKFFLAKNLSWE